MKLKPKKLYTITLTCDIAIDPGIIKEALKPEWQDYIGAMTELEIAQYIGYNILHNGCTLTQIDGFADRRDDQAKKVGRVDVYAEHSK